MYYNNKGLNLISEEEVTESRSIKEQREIPKKWGIINIQRFTGTSFHSQIMGYNICITKRGMKEKLANNIVVRIDDETIDHMSLHFIKLAVINQIRQVE